MRRGRTSVASTVGYRCFMMSDALQACVEAEETRQSRLQKPRREARRTHTTTRLLAALAGPLEQHPPRRDRVVLGRTPPSGCGSSQAASRPAGAMETLTKPFRSRVAASLDRTGMRTSTLGRQAVGDPLPVRQLRRCRSPRLAVACQVPVFIEACRRAHVAPVPSRGNAPRNFSPNRTEADR